MCRGQGLEAWGLRAGDLGRKGLTTLYKPNITLYNPFITPHYPGL